MKRFLMTMILLVTTALPCFGQTRYRESAFFLSLGRRSVDPSLYALLQQIVTNQQLLLQRDRGNDPALTTALQSLSVAVQKIADNQQQILLLLNDLRKPVPDVEGRLSEQRILGELKEIRQRQQEIGRLIPRAPLNPLHPGAHTNPLRPSEPQNPLAPGEPRNPLQPSEPTNPLQPGRGSDPLQPEKSSRPRYFRDFTILRGR